MTVYRLYVVDARSHFQSVQVLECEGDDVAVAEAERSAPGARKELWEGARLVKTWRAVVGTAS